jgi:Tol biopolymer transport system component
MGHVWRAVDTSLDRDVAIKILPSAVAQHPDRLARFEREAKAVAALAHPNILAIYGFGSEKGTAYAVTELLEGETLRERLEEGRIPPRKAIDIAGQVALALGAAHDKGIIHRDIKPENIYLTREGSVKILDFGLAASMAGTGGEAGAASPVPEQKTSLTAPGTVMGTVDYMSPEQVSANPVGPRSDLFSLGSVLYEMLSASKPFHRDSSPETMTAILREDPPELSTLGIEVSAALERVIRRCLEKRPEERFHSAADLAFAIRNSLGTTTGAVVPVVAARPTATPRLRLIMALLVVIAGALGFWLGGLRGRTDPPEPVRLRTLTFSGSDYTPAASPDGRMIAFTSERDGRSRIWIKQLIGGGEQALTDGPDQLPRFSPDGSAVLFLRAEGSLQSIYRQSLVGGQPRKLVENAIEADWSPDGERIAFIRRPLAVEERENQIGVADARQGHETILFSLDEQCYGLRWSPDGERLSMIVTAWTGNTADYSVLFVDPQSGETNRRPFENTGTIVSMPVWNGGEGEMIVGIAGSLIGDQGSTASRVASIDPELGDPTTLFWAEHLFPSIGIRSGGVRMDIVRPGTLVFDAAPVRENLHLFSLDQTPSLSAVEALTQGNGRDRQPVWSPDGRYVLFASSRSGNLDLWRLDTRTRELRQITDDAAQDWDPAYSPDGAHILWSSSRSGNLEIWMAQADGSAARQVSSDGVDAENPTMTADGQWIVYWSADLSKHGIWKVRPDGSDATHLVEGPFLQPEVSPDGKWVTFLELDPERLRNVVRVLAVEDGRVLPHEISVEVPFNRAEDIILGRARWMPDGGAIAFVGQDENGHTGIYVQEFDPSTNAASPRRPLAGFSSNYATESFGISPNGRQVVIAGLDTAYRLVLAEGVPGIVPPERRVR